MNHLRRTRLFSWPISIFALSMTVIACSEPVSEEKETENKDVYITKEMLVRDYKYLPDLKVYLKEHIDAEMTFNEVDSVMFIPMNSCASCVSYTFNAMSINPFSGKIILGGNPDDYEKYQEYITNMSSANPNYYIDSNYMMYDYRIGVSGPTMLLKSGKKWQTIELSIANWPIIVDFLEWKAPDFDFAAGH